jgi:hypothetical protein
MGAANTALRHRIRAAACIAKCLQIIEAFVAVAEGSDGLAPIAVELVRRCQNVCLLLGGRGVAHFSSPLVQGAHMRFLLAAEDGRVECYDLVVYGFCGATEGLAWEA